MYNGNDIHENIAARKLNILKGFSEVGNALENNLLSNELEKGKKAAIGEIRVWQGNKYQKTTNGWIKVIEKKTFVEDYVDEDTGEIVSIEREIKEKQRTDSPSLKRKEKKKDLIERKSTAKVYEKRQKYKDALDELHSLKRERQEIDLDMNEHAGQLGDKWNDDYANEYGEKFNEIDSKISKQESIVKMFKNEYEEAQKNEIKIYNKK